MFMEIIVEEASNKNTMEEAGVELGCHHCHKCHSCHHCHKCHGCHKCHRG